MKPEKYPGLSYRIMAVAIGLAFGGGLIASAGAAEKPVYPTGLTNIAAAGNGGRIIGASSTLEGDPEFNANNLIDGKAYSPAQGVGSKGWASNKFDPINTDWVTLGFVDNKVKRIGKVVLNPVAAVAPERWAKDVELQVSTESAEGPYTTIQYLTLRRVAERQEFTILPAEARFVRLTFRSNWGSDRAVALGEVEIYEAIESTDPLGRLIMQLEGAINELRQFRKTQLEMGNSGAATTTRTQGKPLSPATLQLIQQTAGDAGAKAPVVSGNIAAAANGGKIVDFSSVFENKPEYGPGNLINGKNYRGNDPKTTFGWASEGFKPGREFVTIGFRDDRTKVIDRIVINPVSYQSNLRWARRVDVFVTTGAAKQGPYAKVDTLNLRADGVNQEFTIRPVEAKYVRFVFMANGPGDFTLPGLDPDVNSDRSVSLGEIEIYEKKSDDGTLDALIGRFNQVLIDLKRLRAQNGGNDAGETPPVEPAAFKSSPRTTTPSRVAAAEVKPTIKRRVRRSRSR